LVVSDAAALVGHNRVANDHKQRRGGLRKANHQGDPKFRRDSSQLLMIRIASATRRSDG
jgi:hypothetical protein